MWDNMIKQTTYAKITAKIIFTTLLVTLISAVLYGEYLKRNAINELAQVDAKKTSMLIFESLYSAMKRGWNREDMNEIITRLNQVDKNMQVSVFRGETVSSLYGEILKDKEKRETDKNVKVAMNGHELLDISDIDFIQYYYPVIAKNECLKCHTNANVNDVLGVIDISYPVEELKISLSEFINFFIIFLISFSLIIFFVIFIKLNKYLVKPIKNFSNVIVNITTSKDMTKRVLVNDNIEELDSIKGVFNTMLDFIEYQFYFDNLTGLKNRRKLTELLEERKNIFLMIINIDAFQEINDLYGEEVGDMVLKDFAIYLKDIVRSEGSVFRLHSDEFAYVCHSEIDLDEFELFASLISEKISKKSFKLDSIHEVNLTVSIGVSHGSELLLANADMALRIAKNNKNNFVVYDDSMHMTREYDQNLKWTKRIRDAIENNSIVPVYQPIVDVKTQKILKYESLMRIKDDENSYIAPIHFLELAKKNKLYHQLTKIMIEKTFQRFESLPYSVSINISVEDILNKEIYQFILQKLKNSSISENIVFEIIESEGIENFDQVLEFIDSVKEYGAKISIDDFGTGYSNFEYLMKLKVDYIKIDGSMIKNIDMDENSQLITLTIVNFAKKMNIQTVAEFVHSKEVFEKIKFLDVDFAQGYYFGKPSEEID